MFPTIKHIEKQILAECNGDRSLRFDHSKKLFIWFDPDMGEWCANYYKVDTNGAVEIDPMPPYTFKKPGHFGSAKIFALAAAAGA